MNTLDDRGILRIAVLAGGDSAEREVSLRSGAAVTAALTAAGHEVAAIDPEEARPPNSIDWDSFDVAFLALHGGAGEDGRIQEALERLGVAYTGSGPRACRLAMSKHASKECFHAQRVPTPPHVLVESSQPLTDIVAQVETLGYPLVVKPDSQGSSLGLSIADSPDDLPAALAEAFRFDRAAVVEPLVRGREFTVALIDDKPLPLVEIVTPERVFSYEAKYESTLTEYRFDFQLSAKRRVEILHMASAAARALGTSGLSRVDVLLGHDARVWVLEVNTIPGLTPRSLAPQAAQRAEMDMTVLCDLLARQPLATVSRTLVSAKKRTSDDAEQGTGLGTTRGGRWIALAALVIVLTASVSYAVWRQVRDHVLAGDAYHVGIDDVTLTPPPAWVRADVRAEVIDELHRAGPLLLVDPQLTVRLASAFSSHPWVSHVERVSKKFPSGVDVTLTYRRPVAMVEVNGGALPIDVRAVLLPTGDFSREDADRYPRIGAIHTSPADRVGIRWQDTSVIGAAQIAAVLGPDWQALELARIEPAGKYRGRVGVEDVFNLRTKSGTTIFWGRAPATDMPGETPAADKLAQLKKFFSDQGSFDGAQGPQQLAFTDSGKLTVKARPNVKSIPTRSHD